MALHCTAKEMHWSAISSLHLFCFRMLLFSPIWEIPKSSETYVTHCNDPWKYARIPSWRKAFLLENGSGSKDHVRTFTSHNQELLRERNDKMNEEHCWSVLIICIWILSNSIGVVTTTSHVSAPPPATICPLTNNSYLPKDFQMMAKNHALQLVSLSSCIG